MADTPKHSVSVAGIVVDDQDRVLIIQRRDNGHWEPPGGVLELEESPQRGVAREIYEETGLVVDIEELSGVYKNMSNSVVALVFRCSPAGQSVPETPESREVVWVSLSQIDELMTEAYAVRVKDAFRNEVSIRVHDGVSLLRDQPATL